MRIIGHIQLMVAGSGCREVSDNASHRAQGGESAVVTRRRALQPAPKTKQAAGSSFLGDGTYAAGSRHVGMDFERLLMWMAVFGLIGLALTFAWMLATGR